MDGLAAGLVLVGVAPVDDLLQSFAFGFELDHLELELVNLTVEFDRHIEPPGVANRRQESKQVENMCLD